MDNENKNFQDEESTLNPEEKVQADISSKIADAAAEIQDEIAEANSDVSEEAEYTEDNGSVEETDNSWSDEAWEDEDAEEVKEDVIVSLKQGTFIISLIAAALIGALITFFCFRVPAWIANMPEGNTVITIGNEKITDMDINYHIYSEAAKYASENKISETDLADYDWDQEVDGQKLSDKFKQAAVDAAIDEALLIQKGAENGVTLSDEEKKSIDAQISGITATYGEDGFTLRARTMGIPTIKQYTKMYYNAMTYQAVQEDLSANSDKYYPEDRSVLSEYTQKDKASVKHILIKVDSGSDEAATEEKRAQAQSILDRINAGEDFDALMSEFNEDTGEPAEGYTFSKGEMDIAFEEASFALGIDQVSDIVKSSYGFHIIKRVAGSNELTGYMRAQAEKDIKINKSKLAKLSVTDVMKDVAAAMEEVKSEESAKSSSQTAATSSSK